MLRRQWSLAQVCRRWCHVVLNTPRLWNRPPRIYAGMTHEVDPSSVKTHFVRAGGLPLSIDVSINLGACAKPSRLLATLVKHSNQIGELKIESQWEAFCAISGIRSKLSNLRTLTLTTATPQINNTSVFSLAPQLRGVSFTSTHYRLTVLHMVNCTMDHRATPMGPIRAFTSSWDSVAQL